jgi:hypothetical protein
MARAHWEKKVQTRPYPPLLPQPGPRTPPPFAIATGPGDPAAILPAGPYSFSPASPTFAGAPLGAGGLGAGPPFPDTAAAASSTSAPDPQGATPVELHSAL